MEGLVRVTTAVDRFELKRRVSHGQVDSVDEDGGCAVDTDESVVLAVYSANLDAFAFGPLEVKSE